MTTPERISAKNELLKREVELYKEVQRDIQKNQQAIKQLTQQQNECDLVVKELELISEDDNVFKLVGPVLVKQDPIEAKSNVNKRMEYINNELKRLEGLLATFQEKKSKKEQEIMRLQSELQKTQGSSST